MTLFAPGASELLQVEEWDQSIQQLHSKDLPTLRADLFKLDRKTRRAGPLGMPRSWTVEIGDPERGKDAMCDDNGGLMMMASSTNVSDITCIKHPCKYSDHLDDTANILSL